MMLVQSDESEQPWFTQDPRKQVQLLGYDKLGQSSLSSSGFRQQSLASKHSTVGHITGSYMTSGSDVVPVSEVVGIVVVGVVVDDVVPDEEISEALANSSLAHPFAAQMKDPNTNSKFFLVMGLPHKSIRGLLLHLRCRTPHET